MSLELGQSNEQNVEETHPCLSETISENQQDEIKKEQKDDNTTKEEKCTSEQESVEEHNGKDEVSKENITDLNETTEVEPQEDITPFTSLETSAKDISNSDKEETETHSDEVRKKTQCPDCS